jgi:hypothetical protein
VAHRQPEELPRFGRPEQVVVAKVLVARVLVAKVLVDGRFAYRRVEVGRRKVRFDDGVLSADRPLG